MRFATGAPWPTPSMNISPVVGLHLYVVLPPLLLKFAPYSSCSAAMSYIISDCAKPPVSFV
jgi:hypothetical protein